MLLGDITNVRNSDGTDAPILVNGTATVYTHSFPMNLAEYFGAWIQATSVLGTPKVLIQLQQSYRPPTTEGADDAAYVVADGVADIYAALNDQIAHVKAIAPAPMKYGRYKIVGSAVATANPADTLVTIRNFMQEPI